MNQQCELKISVRRVEGMIKRVIAGHTPTVRTVSPDEVCFGSSFDYESGYYRLTTGTGRDGTRFTTPIGVRCKADMITHLNNMGISARP